MQLVNLDTASDIDNMDLSGFKLHPFKGADSERWSVLRLINPIQLL